MHGVVRFDPKTGVQQKGKPSKTGSYTNYFADSLIAEAERDNRIVAVHAAMAGGTGGLWSDGCVVADGMLENWVMPEGCWEWGLAQWVVDWLMGGC
jgi:hypothetical protein